MRTTHSRLHRATMISRLSFVLAALALAGCGDTNPTAAGTSFGTPFGSLSSANGAPTSPPIVITVLPASTELEVGETVQLAANVRNRPGNSVNGQLQWSSADDAVAIVSDNGRVTAMGSGSTTITASLGIWSGSARITVIPREFTFDVWIMTFANAGVYGIDGRSASDVWFGCGFRCAMRFNGTQWGRFNTTSGANVYGANVQPDGTVYFGAQIGVGTGQVVRWNGVFAPATTTAPSELFGVWSDAPGSGFACGDGRFFRFRSGQPTAAIATGLNVSFNSPDRFEQAWGTSATNVFCAGRSGVYKYNGTAFTRVGTGNMADVTGSSPSNVWAVGRAGVVHRFDGNAWTTVDAGQGTADVRGVGVVSDTWVLLQTSDNQLRIFDGTNWRSQPMPAGYQMSPAGLYAPNRRLVYMAGFRTSDNRVVVIRGTR